MDLVEHIASATRDTPVAMITAFGNVEAAVDALKAGAFDFVTKPVDLTVLRRLVQNALKLRRTQAPQPAPAGAEPPARRLARAMQQLRADHRPRSRAARRRCTSAANRASARNWSRALIHEQGPRASRPLRAGQLRRDPVRADGKRVLRPQEGQLHRRARRQGRPVPGRQRRHPVPRRGGRPAAAHAGQAAARDPGKGRAPDRRAAGSAGRRAHPVGHAQEPGPAGRGRARSATTCTTAST